MNLLDDCKTEGGNRFEEMGKSARIKMIGLLYHLPIYVIYEPYAYAVLMFVSMVD